MNLRKKFLSFLQSQKTNEEYTRLAYLESTGTQWIDTGIEFQPLKAVINLCYVENNTRDLMGFAAYQTTYFGKTADGLFELGGTYVLQGSNAYKWQEVEFIHNGKISGASCTLTTPDGSITRNGNIVDNLVGKNFCLFNVSGANVTYACRCKISSAKFYNPDTNELIMDLIPVLDKNLTPCMYDLVSKKYIYKQGDDEFKWKLPNQLEYLESNGTQWIDTGVVPTENHKIEVVGYSTKVNTGVSLVGTRNVGNYDNRLQIWSDVGGYFSARINNSTFITTYPSTVKSTIVLDIKNKNFTVNNSEPYALNYTDSLAVNSYGLFLRNNGNGADLNYADPVVIYSCKIWESDKLLHYYIPAFDKDLTPCMYDLVSKKYLHNQGDGEFIGKCDDGLSIIGYLESNGEQWIDTGYTPLIGDEIELKNVQCVKKIDGKQTVFSAGNGTYQTIMILADEKSPQLLAWYKYFATGSAPSIDLNAYSLDEPTTIKIDKDGKFYFNDAFVGKSNPIGDVDSTLKLFIRADGTFPMTGKIGTVKIKRDGKIIMNLVPVIKGDGTVCMYDLETGNYLYNQGTGEFNNKPSEYLEYLECDGNQYLMTDYVPNSNTAIEVDYFPNPSSGFMVIYGSLENSNANKFQAVISSTNYCLQINSHNGSGYYGLKNGNFVYGDQEFTKEQIRVVLTVDNYNKVVRTLAKGQTVNYDMTTVSGLGEVNCVYPLALFNCVNGGEVSTTNGYNGRIYSFKIWESDKLVHDLVPVLDKKFVPCMYDKITSKFFYNQGTGEFKWKLPNQLEYLESTGTQYIDTGFIANQLIDKTLYIKMKNTGNAGNFAYNGAYDISGTGLTIQFGLYATSDTQCRTTQNYFDPSYSQTTGLDKSLFHELQMDKTTYWLNGEVVGTHTQTDVEKIKTCLNPFFIFGRTQKNQSNSITSMAISRFWIKDKYGKFDQYLIPAFDNNLNICMYDLVSKKYLYNQGTGLFKGYFEDGSQLVSYLESNGNQYLNLGIVPTTETGIRVKASTIGQGDTIICGSRNDTAAYTRFYLASTYSSATNPVPFISFGRGPYMYLNLDGTFVASNPTLTVPYNTVYDQYTNYKNSKVVRFVDSTNDITSVEIPELTFVPSQPLYLFAGNIAGAVNYNYKGKIYSCEITEGDRVTLRLVPVIKDETCYMYDMMTNTLFENQGTESFTYGTIINLFNPANPLYIPGYVSANNGGNITDSTLTHTFYIPCKPNTTYLISRSSVKEAEQVWRAATVSETPYVGMLCPNYVGGLINDLTLCITSGPNDTYLMFSEGRTMASEDLTKFAVIELEN